MGRTCNALAVDHYIGMRPDRTHHRVSRREPVEENRAGAAHAMLAAEMGARQTELMADEIGKRHAHLDLFLVALAVDRQRDLALLTHAASCCWSIFDNA